MTHRRPVIKDSPFYPDPSYRPPPKPIGTPMPGSSQGSESTDINPDINIDFEENSPSLEDIISEIYQKPGRSFFQEFWELESLIQVIWYKSFYQNRLLLITFKGNTEESTQRYTLTSCNKRDTGRLLNQPILQGHLSVHSSE